MNLYEKNGNILYVLNVLKKYSSSEHILSSNKIRDLILEEYNVEIDSRTVRRNINLLIEKFNYDIDKFPQLKPKGIFDFSVDDLVWGRLSVEDVYNYFVPREK